MWCDTESDMNEMLCLSQEEARDMDPALAVGDRSTQLTLQLSKTDAEAGRGPLDVSRSVESDPTAQCEV